MSRRALAAFLLAGPCALASCQRREGQAPPEPGDGPRRTLVLYTSADAEVVKPIVELFEKETGITVMWTGDTEQTKTTGLVQRIIAEKDSPRADVWWSSEPFGSIRLDRERLLEPYQSKKVEATIPGGWPRNLRATAGTWYGFAQRVRVIVYNTDKVRREDVPRTLASLLSPKFQGRIGMARPAFGTTGGHMAAISSIYGDAALREWLRAAKANGLRLYDGNMAVVRAISTGELLVGLADTDDVWAGVRNRWPVSLVYDPNDLAAAPLASFKGWGTAQSLALGAGPIVLPNTVAIVKGATHTREAQRFVDFLLSERVERMLARSDAHTIPVRQRLLAEPAFARYAEPVTKVVPAALDLEKVGALMPGALTICEEVLAE